MFDEVRVVDGSSVWQPGDPLPQGIRVEFISTTEQCPFCSFPSIHSLESGDQGIVHHIDGDGTVHVDWDSGSRLGLLPRCDRFRVVSP